MTMNMTMNFKTVSRFLSSVVLVFMLAFAFASGLAAEETEKKCPGTVKVLVEEIKGSTFLEFKELEGKILPWKTDVFKSPIAGSIKTLEKKVGSDVKTGDVVALIDDAPIKKEIDAAKMDLKRWQRELRRRENWKVRSERAENQAKRNVKRYTDLLAQKEEELKNTRITSPLDGRIDVLKVNQGDFISKDFVLGTIVNIDTVRILLETNADKVREGQKIKVHIKDISKTVEGVVGKDAEGNTYVYIKNSDKKILQGMTAQFRVLFKTHKNVVVLPREKILKDESGDFVYVVNGKYAGKAVLKTGPVDNGNALILEGLAIGNEIIVSEVLSAKQGTLKEEMDCVAPNKKIKIVVMDAAKGKYVKRKKGMPAVKPVPPIKKVEKVKPVEKKKEEKKVKPKPERKPKPKPVPKKEEREVYAKLEAFITYLQNNKDTLRYEKYRKIVREDSIQVVIYCSAAVRNKLLVVIHKFDLEKYCVVKEVPDKYKVTAFFRTKKARARVMPFISKKFRIGASVGFYKMADTNFDEVYGSMTSFGFDISYLVTDKLDIWFYAGTGSKTAEIDWSEEDLKFKFTPLSLDLRYHFKRTGQWDFFAGAGLNIYPFEDTNPIEDVKESAAGLNILGGIYYNITRSFSLQLFLRYNIVKKTIENADNDLDMTSLEALFGVSVRF